MSKCERRIQCKACPWKKSTVPDRDIPGGYSVEKHKNLRRTIAEEGDVRGIFSRAVPTMACHESKPGRKIICVGWLANQLGPGNNLALRMQALAGQLPKYELVGEQHERFEDTLPKPKRRKRCPDCGELHDGSHRHCPECGGLDHAAAECPMEG